MRWSTARARTRMVAAGLAGVAVTAVVASVPVAHASPAPALVVTAPRILVDTHTGVQAAKRQLLGDEQLSVLTLGLAGVPADGAAAVRLRVEIDSGSGTGVLSIRHAPPRDPRPAVLPYAKAATRVATVTVSAGQSGRLIVENVSRSRVGLRIWVTGYQPMANLGTDEWRQEGADAGGSQANPAATGVTTSSLHALRQRWTTPGTDPEGTQPLIVAGVVYTLPDRSADNQLTATSLATGHVLWTLAGFGTSIQLAVYGQLIYVGTASSTGIVMTAVSLATHHAIWTEAVALTTPASQLSRPMTITGEGDNDEILTDGGVVALAEGNYLTAFDAADGTVLWARNDISPGPLAGDGKMFVYYGHSANIVDLRTGRPLWRLNPIDFSGGGLIVAGDRLITVDNTVIEAYSLRGCGHATCGPVWTASTGFTGSAEYFQALAATSSLIAVVQSRTPFDNSPTLTRFRTLNAATGAVLADRNQIGQIGYTGPPVIAGSAVLIGRASDILAMPTSCHGACAFTTVLTYGPDGGGNPVASLAIAQHTLLVTEPTHYQQIACTIPG